MANNARSPEGPRFRFTLVGRFSVQQDGRPLQDTVLGGRKQRTLLKLLLVNRGHVVSTENIAEALWAENQPAVQGDRVTPFVGAGLLTVAALALIHPAWLPAVFSAR